MDTKVNYIVVGLFMTILTLGIIGSTIWLAGVHSTKKYNTYVTYMNEAVTGLSEKAPVKFNGVEVGFVDKVGLNKNNPQQVRLVLKIQENVPITEATRASLLAQGLTGIAVVGLTAQQVKAPPLKKKPGQHYPIIPSKPSLLFRLDQTVEVMSQSVSSVAKNLNELLNDENRNAVKNSLQHLSEITGLLDKNSKAIDEALSSVGKIAKNSEIASNRLPQLMDEFEISLKEAKAAATNLRALSAKGNQSIDDLTQQTLPNAQQVMTKLKRSLDNVEQLTGELNKNPAMLLRGRNPAPLGPGER